MIAVTKRSFYFSGLAGNGATREPLPAKAGGGKSSMPQIVPVKGNRDGRAMVERATQTKGQKMADDTMTPPRKPAKPGKKASSGTTTTIETPGETAGSATQTLKEGATKLTRDATSQARGYAEEGKARAGGALDELSKMMTDAAGTVDSKLGAQYGQYARSAADAISSFSGSLKDKEIDDLIDDARDFVKKSPAIAIGTAAALGFVLVRLIKSGLDADTNA